MTTESDALLDLAAIECRARGTENLLTTDVLALAARVRELEADAALIATERANYRTEMAVWLRTVQEQNAKIEALEQERATHALTHRGFEHLRGIVLAALEGLQRRYDDLPEDDDAAAERMRAFVDALRRREETLIDEVNAAEKRHDAAIAGIVDGLTKRLDEALNYAHDGTPLSAVAELTGARDSIATLHAAALARHAAEVERVRGVEAAIRSLGRTLATNARDWSLDRADAWLYGALCGWDEALPEVAARHGWSAEDVARLEAIRATLNANAVELRAARERIVALDAERDEVRADRDALAAGLDAISDILDGMMEGASREETQEALYVAAIQAWNAAARGTFRPNEWWRPFADAHIARCGADGIARARAAGVREGREDAARVCDRLATESDRDAEAYGTAMAAEIRSLPSPAAPPVAGAPSREAAHQRAVDAAIDTGRAELAERRRQGKPCDVLLAGLRSMQEYAARRWVMPPTTEPTQPCSSCGGSGAVPTGAYDETEERDERVACPTCDGDGGGAPEPTPGPLTNCDSCAHDYTDPPGAASHPHRWCAAYKKGDRRSDIDVWCRDNIGDHGAPLPGATGCPGYLPRTGGAS